MDTKEAGEFINFVLGFRAAAYGTSIIVSHNQDFQAGKSAGELLYPVTSPIPAEVVLAAYEKWKS